MADKLPRIELYPGDWLRDSVSGCSLAAQGLWLRMMFLAHDSTRYGYLELNGVPMQPEFIARRCGADTAQYTTLLSELVVAGVPSVTEDGILYSRRMARDANLRAVRAKAGSKGGKQTAKQKRSKRSSKVPATSDNDTDNDNRLGIELENRSPLPPILDCDLFREAFAKWLAYKKERRESYKPTGLAGVISAAENRAKLHGIQAVVEAMGTAMANGWQGWDQKSLFGANNGNRPQQGRTIHRHRG